MLHALGLPILSALRLETIDDVRLFMQKPLAHRDQLVSEYGVSVAELHALEALPPRARACANAALCVICDYPGDDAPEVRGDQGFGAELQRMFREVWGIPQTLEELAAAGCPWLRLPSVGVLDLGTCWGALREYPACRAGLVPAGHPLRQAFESLIAVLVAAPDGTPQFSRSVREDVRELEAVIRDDAIFDAPRKHIVTLPDCTAPEQLTARLHLLRLVREKEIRNENENEKWKEGSQ